MQNNHPLIYGRGLAMNWKVFLYNGDMEYLLFAIAGLFYYKSVFKEARVRHIAWSFLCCFCSNFMSFTFSAYSPLWPDPRHFLFLIPFAVITGAYMLAAYMREPGKYMGLLFCFWLPIFSCWFRTLAEQNMCTLE